MASGFSTSLSGISSAFSRQDVTADNLSNLNTDGFKQRQVQQSTSEAGGSRIESVSASQQQGPLVPTGREQDVAIEGSGFFAVQKQGQTVYTRSGSFDLDADGNLVNTVTGGSVKGFSPGDTGGTAQPLTVQDSERTLEPEATDSVRFGGNISSDLSEGESTTLAFDVTDSQGTARTINLTLEKSSPNTVEFTATDPSNSRTALNGQLQFDSQGRLASKTVSESPNAPDGFKGLYLSGNGANPVKASADNLDFSAVTQQAGETSFNATDVSGRQSGQLRNVSVTDDGTVRGQYSNGETRSLGTVALASFSNPSGLQSDGNSLFSASSNSGEAQLGVPGSGPRGSLQQGVLEASNVDMSDQLTEMLVNQNTAEANIDALKVQDEMMGSLLDMTG
ncbi:MAG: flagellar hook protein FlgE [bacterium]